MSVSSSDLLHQQLARGEYEQAAKTAITLSEAKQTAFADFVGLIQHAVNARQQDIAVVLLNGSRRFFVAGDAAALRQQVVEMTAVLASCWREKLDEPARVSVALVLQRLEAPGCPVSKDDGAIVAQFAGWAGRFALRQRDMAWFGEIALQTAGWATRNLCAGDSEAFLPAFDFWLHRILRQGNIEAIPVLFEALFLFLVSASEKEILFHQFLREWRVIAASACLNPESPLAAQLVEQLLLFTVRIETPAFWPPVSGKIGEVAALTVSTHGIKEGLPVFRPLLDVGRVNLGDELKFGTGPDPDSNRQRIIRLICCEALKIADMAAHRDMLAVAGDKIEEIYRNWVADPQYEPQIRSIQRFCQLLLIFWSNNRKRAAKKWTPREKVLSEPLLLTEEDRIKLAFLL